MYLKNNVYFKVIFGVLIFTLLTLRSFTVAQDSLIVQDPDPQRFAAEIGLFETWDSKNSYPDNAILFTGSSSIRLWPTHDMFPAYKVINRGFGGAHISDMLRYFEQIAAKYKPRILIFYCGDNDLAHGKSPERVLSDFTEFIRRLEVSSPQTSLLYLPIKPSGSRWHLWPIMKEANELIRRYCDTKSNLHYVDTAAPLLTAKGEPDESLFRDDQLHLNAVGYDLWTEVVDDFLRGISAMPVK